ncbi:MAG: hypothetical protein ABIH67_04790 [Candidatus Uhrbacteria bacterium]
MILGGVATALRIWTKSQWTGRLALASLVSLILGTAWAIGSGHWVMVIMEPVMWFLTLASVWLFSYSLWHLNNPVKLAYARLRLRLHN